jgi:hypothetical protein
MRDWLALRLESARLNTPCDGSARQRSDPAPDTRYRLGGYHEFQFCDYGIMQFWIKPEDLAARRFDRCYATTEGG